MNRENYIDSMSYWFESMYHAESNTEPKEYPEWRTQCLNKPYWRHPNPKVLGKVTAVDYTSDKDHSSACIYCTLNPDGSEWIDFLKKRSGLEEQQQRISVNSHYCMYVEEKPKFDLKNYLCLKNGETIMTMSQAEIEYDEKKKKLLREQESRKIQAKLNYDEECATIEREYEELFLHMDKEKEAAEQKEKAEAHAKAMKETYDAYIAQGFTKTQAEAFIKIGLPLRIAVHD